MATSSVGGGASIIDVESIVSSLMQVERKRVTAVEAKLGGKNVTISALGALKSKASALEAALAALEQPDKVTARTVSSSVPDAVTAEVTSSAALADTDVRVLTTARASRVVAGGFASETAAVGNGSLTLETGGYSTNAGVTTFSATTTKSITLAEGATLTQMRDAINAADAGMTANIVQTGETYSLVVTGKDTGTKNDIRIVPSAAQNLPASSAPNFTSIAYSAASNEVTSASVLQSAQNAVVYLDGLRVERSSNKIENAVPGVTFQLRKPTSLNNFSDTTSVSISVSEKEGQVRAALGTVVSAYNDFYKTYGSLSAPGAAGANRGALNMDSAVRSVVDKLRAAMTEGMVYSSTDSNGVTTSETIPFFKLGVELQRDGTLKLNETQLSAALADGTADKLKAGVSVSAQAVLSSAVAFTGEFDTRLSAVKESRTALEKNKLTLQDKMVTIEASYRRRYASLDALLSRLNGINDSVTQVLSQLTSQNND